MPRESANAGSFTSWLKHAQSDLAFARAVTAEDGMFETRCFHAQQAAEKALKAALIYFGEAAVPRTHVIEALLNSVALHIAVPIEIRQASGLTPYASTFRYPGDYEPLTESDYLDRLEKAERVVGWVVNICKP